MPKIKLSKEFIRNTVKLALNEDLFPSGDITSSLIENNKLVTVKLLSNQNAVIGGLLFARQDFELIDISITPVPGNILEKAIENFGKALINKRSLTWQKLDIETRQKQAHEIIRLHPKVMKRPLVEFKSGDLSLGFKASKGSIFQLKAN